ncbi:MAG TPA: hypothetical protein PK453_03985 [Leptospiraceae bacterium]|nr:hypothetical protein [Leptospiraceae bacterium]HMY65937.1 hypothetical protein [Leptospiraceae bacterium]HNF12804.1 hypothetical protein [Leptospiraceae bacterium]HNI97459.1 hypothetical protein [Leptospiraceae bacterium]HNM01402.1 hypothetical protein [Leptospiraceae bacterium]
MKKILMPMLFLLTADYCTTKEKDSGTDAFLLARFVKQMNKPKQLPHQLSNSIPKSLKKSPYALNLDVKASSITESVGYKNLNEATEELSEILDMAQFEILLIEESLDKAKQSPGTCIAGGTSKITVTDEMLKEYISGLKRSGLSDTEASDELAILQNEGRIPKSGALIPSPAIIYTPLNSDYSGEVSYSFSTNYTSEHGCPSGKNSKFKKHMKFSSDFKKVEFGFYDYFTLFSKEIEFSGSIHLAYSASGKAITHFNNSFSVDGVKTSNVLALEECEKDSASDCNIVKLVTELEHPELKALNSHNTTSGRVDDNGGYLETTYKYGFPEVTLKTKEYFDAEGKLKGYQEDTGGGYTTPYASLAMPSVIPYATGNYSLDDLNIGLTTAAELTDGESFVIVLDGVDPNTDNAAILGEGIKNTADTDIEYWGAEAQISTADVWKTGYDSNNEPYYILLSSTGIKKI